MITLSGGCAGIVVGGGVAAQEEEFDAHEMSTKRKILAAIWNKKVVLH